MFLYIWDLLCFGTFSEFLYCTTRVFDSEKENCIKKNKKLNNLKKQNKKRNMIFFIGIK